MIKPKGVTTQMKALDEYFLMSMFTFLLNRVHVSANFVSFEQRNMAVKVKYEPTRESVFPYTSSLSKLRSAHCSNYNCKGVASLWGLQIL